MKWIKQLFCDHRFHCTGYKVSKDGKNRLGECKFCGKTGRFK